MVQQVLEKTLSSPALHAMLTKIIIDESVPKLIEAISVEGRVRPNDLTPPVEVPSRTLEESNKGATPAMPSPANESFTVVKSKRRRRKTKAIGNEESGKGDPKATTALPVTPKPKSMAEIVKSLPLKPTQAPKPTYLTISGTGLSPVDIINGLPSPAEIGVKAEIVRATKAGSVLVRLDDSSHVTKVIGWQELREKGLQAKLALRKKPRLEVRGVPHGWDSAELVRFLWGRITEKSVSTQLIKDDIRTLFSSKARNGFTKNWVLEVHPMVRFILMDMGSVEGGWWSMSFKDYLDAPRCTKCQGYGHTKATCKEDAVVCIWCGASGHVMKECPRKNVSVAPNCINCERANTPLTERKHKSGSRECPVHLKWAKDVAKSTYYE